MIGVVVEVDVAVGAGEGGLILAAALCVETRFERMRADDLRDVINEVESVVLIDKRQPVEIYVRERLIANPAESEIRHVPGANIREQLRDVNVALARQSVVISGAQINEVAAGTEDEFIGERRAEGVRQCQDRKSTRLN